MSNPLVESQEFLDKLNHLGMGIYVRDENLIVRDPFKNLNETIREEIRNRKISLYAILLRKTLRRTLRLVEMDPGFLDKMPKGLYDEWQETLSIARADAGDIWEGRDDFISQ